jgi:hypothetical protein
MIELFKYINFTMNLKNNFFHNIGQEEVGNKGKVISNFLFIKLITDAYVYLF